MTNAVNALLAAVQQAVKADAALIAVLGPQGISDRTIRSQRFPALVVGSVEARDFSTGEADGAEILLTLEAWSAVSRREAEGLVSEFRRVADGLPEMLDGFRLVNFRHRRTVSRREVRAGLFVAEAGFRAVVE
jgi:tryptophan 2,3-dioxygenase